MAIVDELVTILGFEADTSDADKMIKAIGDIGKIVKKANFALAGFTTGVLAFGNSLISSVEKTDKLADTLGISIEELQAFQYAAVGSGVSIKDMNSDLTTLQSVISGMTIGNINDAIAILGLNIKIEKIVPIILFFSKIWILLVKSAILSEAGPT